MRVAGVLNDWDDVCPLLGHVDQVTTTADKNIEINYQHSKVTELDFNREKMKCKFPFFPISKLLKVRRCIMMQKHLGFV